MKKLAIIILICAAFNLHAQDKYIFTNTSRTVSIVGEIGKTKTDEITWLFNIDSCKIEVITETENIVLTLREIVRIKDSNKATDIYRTDIGVIRVNFTEKESRCDFTSIVWIIDDNEFIYKMK